MRDDLGIANIVPIKVALTFDQVDELQLPPNLMQAKETSPNYAKFSAEFGDDVYEREEDLGEAN